RYDRGFLLTKAIFGSDFSVMERGVKSFSDNLAIDYLHKNYYFQNGDFNWKLYGLTIDPRQNFHNYRRAKAASGTTGQTGDPTITPRERKKESKIIYNPRY